MPDPPRPAISIIVPAHNSAGTIARCLAGLCAQTAGDDEVIVVDDGSSDDTARVAARLATTVHTLGRCGGVAAARNRGAALARHEVLFFVDADVVAHADALARGRSRMADERVDAVIGSYDDTPDVPTIVSQFKNLAHHHFHQRAAGEVASFWGACGLVRRAVFVGAGGFDEACFAQPSIEDVELGWRMARRGARIVLDPDLQVTHLKRWTLPSLVAADVMRRAIPWARHSMARRRLPGELNASPGQWMAALLAPALVGAAVAATRARGAWIAVAAVGFAAWLINRRLYALFWRKGGTRLLVAGFALQQLYYLYAALGFLVGVCLHCAGKRLPESAPPAAARC